MTNDDEVWFVLTFGGMFFGLGFISIFGQVYLCFFKMQEILSLLRNSFGILERKPFLERGVFGSYLMLTCVGAFLTLPSWAIKGGGLDKEDYLNFPLGLLTLIRFFYVAALGSGAAMLVMLIGCKYMGWID
ncbi:hypothetical protein [Pseudomonas sp. PD9R]|uniref:hypothetical protein n=1 Tax=Pseudomonas sp. PD9R TaxID=2853534 RepID=UPI001C444D83|nr:hypothetical protein [Pseudomonas sp. PD9R]MBV6824349.1 hypothetical protein [Pseudomonas sp. PD9R]